MIRRHAWPIAAACGVVCAVCIALYAQSLEQEYAAQRDSALERFGGEQVNVCVASRDILPGETLDSANVTMRPWLVDLLPEGAVERMADLPSPIASVPIYQGEPIVARRTGAPEANRVEIPEGLAAVSVPARDVSAVGGSVAPGLKVDVYATSKASTDAIARNVLVLATSATSADGQPSQLSWVTLAVKPEFVEELIAAAQRTDLYFSISNGPAPALGRADEGKGEVHGPQRTDMP